MSKCLKIICCYFGKRGGHHNTPTNIFEFVKLMVDNELNIDNGYDTDVLFIINECGETESKNYLLNLNGTETKNGKLIVETRHNQKGSFGAYYDMFLKYMNNYNHFFFCEDDVLIYKENYIKEFIEYCDSDESIGFVSLAPIYVGKTYPKHSGGGCGLTSKEKFIIANPINDILNYVNDKKKNTINVSYQKLTELEINFTNKFVLKNMDLFNHPKFSPLCSNYSTHFGHKVNFKQEYLNLEFIYKVGF